MLKNAQCSTQKSKKILGRGYIQTPQHWLRSLGGALKHSNQYNSRLLLSAKIAPRRHQNALFSTQKPKNFWREAWEAQPPPKNLPNGRGTPPSHTLPPSAPSALQLSCPKSALDQPPWCLRRLNSHTFSAQPLIRCSAFPVVRPLLCTFCYVNSD